MSFLFYCLSIVFICSLLSVTALDNGLALTPPMGWLSWGRFRCIIDCKKDPKNCISLRLIKSMVDFLVLGGYKSAGYEYIVIDDCWMAEERDDGLLVADPERFPNGMREVSAFVHSYGLKFGIYGDYGNFTCAGFPGSLNYLKEDAETFAEWKSDFVKFDGCNVRVTDMDKGYPEFGEYLNATGRPMVYSCSWPYYQHNKNIMPNYTSIVEHCNMWRNFDDIEDSWRSTVTVMNWYGANQDFLIPNSGPGHWNDPDMLLIGGYGLSYDQSVAQMAIWCVLAAPLMMSADLRTVQPQFKKILVNRDAIAINKDPLGIQGRRVYSKSKLEIWMKPILPMTQNDDYSFAIVFLNLRDTGEPIYMTRTLSELGLNDQAGYSVHDIFGNRDMGTIFPEYKLNIEINPCGAVLLRAVVSYPKSKLHKLNTIIY